MMGESTERICPCGCGKSWRNAVLDLTHAPRRMSEDEANAYLEEMAARKVAAEEAGVTYR